VKSRYQPYCSKLVMVRFPQPISIVSTQGISPISRGFHTLNKPLQKFHKDSRVACLSQMNRFNRQYWYPTLTLNPTAQVTQRRRPTSRQWVPGRYYYTNSSQSQQVMLLLQSFISPSHLQFATNVSAGSCASSYGSTM
jgi:hypothetical protein